MKKFRLSLLAATLLITSLTLTACDDILQTDPDEVLSPLTDIADLSYAEEVTPLWDSFGEVTALNQYADTYAISQSGRSQDGNLLVFTGSRENDPSALTPGERNESVTLVYHVERNEIVYAKEYVAIAPEATALEASAATAAARALTGATVTVSFETQSAETEETTIGSSLFTVYVSETERSTNRVSEYTTLFDTNGAEIASTPRYETVVTYNDPYFEFDNCLYRISSENQISKIATIPAYNQISPFDYFDGTYFYYLEDRSMEIYDAAMQRIYHWEESNDSKTVYLHVLDNGNILAQTIELLPEDATEYNLLSGKNKYRFVSLLIKPFIDSEQEIELDFIVRDLQTRKANPDFLAPYADTISNVATVTYIQDQRVDMNTQMLVSLTNEAKFDKSLKVIDSHISVQQISTPGNGYWIVSENAQHHVFDKDGNEIAAYNQELLQTHRFLIETTLGTVYNYALEVLYQCDEYTQIFFIGDDYLILRRHTGSQTSYIYFDGNEKVLYAENANAEDSNSQHLLYSRFYVLRITDPSSDGNAPVEWSFYNVSGKQLGHMEAVGLHLYHESDHGALLQDTDGHFYRIGE